MSRPSRTISDGSDQRWAFVLGAPSVRGRLRTSCEDFHVVEQLPFQPSGDGPHQLLLVEKTDLTTPQAAAMLARHSGVDVKHIGYCGMKDRRAVTRQWFSVPEPVGTEVDWSTCGTGVAVLQRHKHRKKLRRGAHSGNRFHIVVRELADPEGQLDSRLCWLQKNGMPNYFGEQRFGRHHRNLALARALFAGSRLRRIERSMAISAARSLIFNDVLSSRVEDGTWNRLQEGDVAGLDGSRSVFPVDELDETLRRRAECLDIHPTGPLWGDGTPTVSGAILTREREVAAQHPELTAGLSASVQSGRRSLRAVVRDLAWSLDGESLLLTFGLDRGQFATALLREIILDEGC